LIVSIFKKEIIVQFPSSSSFPNTGDKEVLYVDATSNNLYYWDGSSYIITNNQINLGGTVQYFNNLPSPVSSYTDQTYYVKQYDILTPTKLSGFYRSDGVNWVRRSDKVIYSLLNFTGVNKIIKTNGTGKEVIETLIEIDGSNNLDLKGGGLKDTNVATAIKLGSVADISLNTTKQDIIGGINELKLDKEDVSNKENTTLDTSTTKYPTNRLTKEYVDNNVATTFNGLTDTNFTSLADEDVIKYDIASAKWINITKAALKTLLALVKGDVGLGNVDNTSDATKNIATAILTNKTIDSNDNTILNITNSNINSGANIDVSKIGTGIISNVEFNHLDNISSNIQTQFNNKEPVITAGTTDQYYRGDKTFQTLNKSAIGLDNVQNVNTTVASNINYNNGSSGLSSNNVQSAIDEAVSLISDLPAGTIIFYTASTIPSGYLLANGASISKTTYADLYTVYGNKYGETATNFTIPDLLSYGNSYGMFVRAGILSNVGRVQNDQIKAHSHQISSVNWSNEGGSAKVFKRGKNNTSSSDPFDTDNNGSQVETRPKSFTALALIKY